MKNIENLKVFDTSNEIGSIISLISGKRIDFEADAIVVENNENLDGLKIDGTHSWKTSSAAPIYQKNLKNAARIHGKLKQGTVYLV